MVKIGSSTKLFAGVGLAVPRLGNVRLRLHFLRRGTSGAISEVVDFCKIELRKVDSSISYSDLETRLLKSDSLIVFTGRYVKKSDKIGASIAILKTNENVYIINHHIRNESPDTLTHKSNIFEDLINKLKVD